MIFTRGKHTVLPITKMVNSWDRVDTCKHFFPGDRLGEDVKGGVIINPQTGYAFEEDSRGCFRSTCLSQVEYPTAIDGAWAPYSATQSVLIVHAGYINSELSVATVAPDWNRTMRFAVGDLNAFVDEAGVGFGISDGLTYRASPLTNSRGQSHVMASTNADGITTLASDDNTYTTAPTTQSSLGDRIYSACSTTVPFFRYALARKDTHVLQSGTYRCDTGASIFVNDRDYGSYSSPTIVHSDVQLPAYFRMHGYWLAGAAIFVFDTIPSANSLMLGMQTMAKAWSQGDYIIYPYWD